MQLAELALGLAEGSDDVRFRAVLLDCVGSTLGALRASPT